MQSRDQVVWRFEDREFRGRKLQPVNRPTVSRDEIPQEKISQLNCPQSLAEQKPTAPKAKTPPASIERRLIMMISYIDN